MVLFVAAHSIRPAGAL